MKILDILNAPWAILPENYLEIREIYLRHARKDSFDLAALEAKLGQPLDNQHQPYSIAGPQVNGQGVAVIPVDGVLSKRMNLFSQISGGTSTQLLTRDFKAALADHAVHSILFTFDSPGGQVDGTHELASIIHAARGVKPIVALADSTTASAAYWIASAADGVFSGSKTTQVGSIGVIAKHSDYSKAEEMQGMKVTLISSGGEKALVNEHMPLSPDGYALLKSRVDKIYGIFVNDVAKNRRTTPQDVMNRMAEGRLFIGQDAVDAGLVDGIATQEQLIGDLTRQAEMQHNGQAFSAALSARLRDLQISI